MPGRDIIVIGASAGGIEALGRLVRGLPPGLPAALFVVCHFPSKARSYLPEILSRQGPLLAHHARHGEPIYPGQIYVAPPDYHLVLEPGRVRLNHGPRENHFRPAIDPLFRSVARNFGERVVAVMLSGTLSDGVAGLLAVRAARGLAVVQDPHDALLPSLPQTARDIAGADYVVPAGEIGELLAELVQQSPLAGGLPHVADPMEKITQTATHDLDGQARQGRPGTISVFTCPECGGCLWQLDERELVRFRCHVGHSYLAETLLEAQSDALEAALWTAIRTFREKSVLARQMAQREHEAENAAVARRYEDEARLADHYGELIRESLLQGPGHGQNVSSKDEQQEEKP